MTKEERAKRWFRRIPNSEAIALEKKMEICARVARKIVFIVLMGFFIEAYCLFVLGGGVFLNELAGLLNGIAETSHSKTQMKGLAIFSAALASPLFVAPLLIAIIAKNALIKSEALKAIAHQDYRESYHADHEEKISFGKSDKRTADWMLNSDGTLKKVFALSEIFAQLTLIKNGVVAFIVLTPPKPIQTQEFGRSVTFVQVCQDKNPKYFHFEIATSNEEGYETLIYSKDGLSEEAAKILVQNLFEQASVPELWDWALVFTK